MKIKSRLMASSILIGIIPLLILSLGLYASYRHDVIQKVLDHLESASAIQQARVRAILAQQAERVALVASRTQLRLSLDRYLSEQTAAPQARMNRILADALRSVPDFEAIRVYTTAGEVVAAAAPQGTRGPLPSRSFMLRAQEGPVVDEVYVAADGVPRNLLGGPMTLDGRLLGVVVIESQVAPLLAALADTSGLGRTGETILARPEEPEHYTFLGPTRFRQDATLQGFQLRHRAGRQRCNPFVGRIEVECIDYRGHAVLASGARIPDTDWSVVVKIDEAEALAQLNRVGWAVLLSVVSMVGIMVTAAGHFAGRLANPLTELTEAAFAMSTGALDQQVPVRSRDELGELAGSFNLMAERVATAHKALEERVVALDREVTRRQAVEREREQLIAELTRAMADLKTLAGIIPICSSCKKIRDDQGYWNQLEAYISEHSDAQFSHGLCPECFKRLSEELDAGLGPEKAE